MTDTYPLVLHNTGSWMPESQMYFEVDFLLRLIRLNHISTADKPHTGGFSVRYDGPVRTLDLASAELDLSGFYVAYDNTGFSDNDLLELAGEPQPRARWAWRLLNDERHEDPDSGHQVIKGVWPD